MPLTAQSFAKIDRVLAGLLLITVVTPFSVWFLGHLFMGLDEEILIHNRLAGWIFTGVMICAVVFSILAAIRLYSRRDHRILGSLLVFSAVMPQILGLTAFGSSFLLFLLGAVCMVTLPFFALVGAYRLRQISQKD